MFNHSISYQLWGNSTASGVFAILFAAWIGTSNMSLIVLFITNPKLLNSRQNIVLLHNTIADLTAGVFFCPLLSEYYLRGLWPHGCNSFFVWFTFSYPLSFLTVHSLLMVLVLKAVPLYCRNAGVRLNRAVANVIFSLSFLALWVYLVAVCVYLDNTRGSDLFVTIAPGVQCKGFMAVDRAYLIDVLVYFLPASLCVVLLVLVIIREKTSLEIPRTQLQLDTITDQNPGLSLRSLSSITLLTALFPLPSFVTTSVIASSGACQSHSCVQWLGALSSLSDWLMVSKSGIVPLILLYSLGRHAHFWSSASPSSSSPSAPLSSSSSLRGVMHGFRRVSGRRDRLMADDNDIDEDNDNENDNRFYDEDDDAPFSSM